jgi:hypothetical protein
MNLTAFALSPGLWLTIDALAVYRLTRLVTTDTLTSPLRMRLLAAGRDKMGNSRPGPLRAYARNLFDLVTCAWCSSMWIAGTVVLLTVYVPSYWKYAAYVLALSAVAGFLSERS